ncbi:hypothetical protein PDJAM_G00057550 [Pangasius djambal]|uniref:Uncharacterized protein n=1 Tax=Pangasius djambal TaxID=1691987 RepID=A0ACC5YXL0_9TELE|nr:hypothetical protein [Pangasius djambal]
MNHFRLHSDVTALALYNKAVFAASLSDALKAQSEFKQQLWHFTDSLCLNRGPCAALLLHHFLMKWNRLS